MSYYVRKVRIDDLDRLLFLFEGARQLLEKQWKEIGRRPIVMFLFIGLLFITKLTPLTKECKEL